MTMERRPLGLTGLSVGVLGLGTVKLGRNVGVKYPGGGGYALPSDEDAIALLTAAADVGINLIDTAPAYGVSEERLGTLMKRAGWLGGRDQWAVCTKAGEAFDPSGGGSSRFDFSAAAVRGSIERSLTRLGTDRVEVALLHSDGRDAWILEHSGGLEALADLKRQGKARAIGISSKTVEGGLMALERGCDVVMVALSAEDQSQLPVIAAAGARGVGVLLKKALASGHAADPAASLRMAVGTPGVSCVVVGMGSAERVRANAAVVGG